MYEYSSTRICLTASPPQHPPTDDSCPRNNSSRKRQGLTRYATAIPPDYQKPLPLNAMASSSLPFLRFSLTLPSPSLTSALPADSSFCVDRHHNPISGIYSVSHSIPRAYAIEILRSPFAPDSQIRSSRCRSPHRRAHAEERLGHAEARWRATTFCLWHLFYLAGISRAARNLC